MLNPAQPHFNFVGSAAVNMPWNCRKVPRFRQEAHPWFANAAMSSAASRIRTAAGPFIIQPFLYPAWSEKSFAAASPVLPAAGKKFLYIQR